MAAAAGLGGSSTTGSSGSGSSSGHDLVLDPSIRNWGVLPILVFVLAVNLIRAFLQLLGTTAKPPEKEELRRKYVRPCTRGCCIYMCVWSGCVGRVDGWCMVLGPPADPSTSTCTHPHKIKTTN